MAEEVLEEEQEEEECPKCPPAGAPAWMATFADMATLLMAFFVLILSFAEFNVPKFKQISGSLREAFGKGTVQNLIALDRFFRNSDEESFGQLKITLAKYYRISGSSTQKIGVRPDIEFPNSFDREIYTENSRKNALKWDEIERFGLGQAFSGSSSSV